MNGFSKVIVGWMEYSLYFWDRIGLDLLNGEGKFLEILRNRGIRV